MNFSRKKIIYNFFGKNFDCDFQSWFKDEISSNFETKSVKYFSLKQIHSDRVFHLKDYSQISEFDQKEEGDAIITSLKDIFIGVHTADCIPLVIFCESSKIVAIVHSGHLGSFLEVAKKTVLALSEIIKNFNPAILHASIGPHIFCETYEVGREFFEKWIQKDSRNEKYFSCHVSGKSKYFFDNTLCVFDQLLDSGLLRENIEISRINTFTNEHYYSYRKMNLQTKKRNISIVGIF